MDIFKLLEDLFARNRNYDRICDLFAVPPAQRGESYVSDQIIERIKTFQTSYILRQGLVRSTKENVVEDPKIETDELPG